MEDTFSAAGRVMNGQPDTATAIAALDQAMKALVLAKSALLGEGSAALFISAQDLPAAEASPGNPYGSTKHGEFTAGSAAEVAEGVPGWDDPLPGEPEEARCASCGHKILKRTDGHGWVHAEGLFAAICTEGSPQPAPNYGLRPEPGVGALHSRTFGELDGPDFCPAQWGEPPETMLCSLASGHDGNHATAEGIEWGGRWETAEPHPEGEPTPRELAAGYSLSPKDGAR